MAKRAVSEGSRPKYLTHNKEESNPATTVWDELRFSSMTMRAVNLTEDSGSTASAPSMPEWSQNIASKKDVQMKCGLSSDKVIEDVHRCTPLQEQLMASNLKSPGSHIDQWVFRLQPTVDHSLLQNAWEKTVMACPQLRARIVRVDGFVGQVVVKNDIVWDATRGMRLHDYTKTVNAVMMGYGSQLVRYALIKGQGPDACSHFVLVAHQAALDKWSIKALMCILQQFYMKGKVGIIPSFRHFINQTENMDHQVMASYWHHQLQNARAAPFPPRARPEKSKSHFDVCTYETIIELPNLGDAFITKATALRSAWAMVIARYSDLDDITLGFVVSGRQGRCAGTDLMIGPTAATVPMRFKINRQESILDFMRSTEEQTRLMVPHQHFGVSNIAQTSEDAKSACQFTSLMIAEPADKFIVPDEEEVISASKLTQGIPRDLKGLSLMFRCLVDQDHCKMVLTYRTDALTEGAVEALCKHYSNALQTISTNFELEMGKVHLSGPWDIQRSRQWNKNKQDPVNTCVHDLISKRAMLIPNNQAIYSSDGSLSYAELDKLASDLGRYLASLGVGPETTVLVCFERSIWAIVTMLGILKAGGAFVPLDPSYTSGHRKAIADVVRAGFVVTSPRFAGSCQGMVSNIVELSPSLIEKISTPDASEEIFNEKPHPTPTNAAYVLFTSGSTGEPKAVKVGHRAFSSSIRGRGRAYELNKQSRVLQFWAYTSNVSLGEIFETLVFGGTICTPSERESFQSLPQFMMEANVNTAMFKPSYLETLDPTEMPPLELLILTGEMPTKEVLKKWYPRTRLVNAYGACETSIFITSYEYQFDDDEAANIGRAFSGSVWIVEPSNINKLAPVGCPGEILIEREMATGYLNDGARTKNDFFTQVDFLQSHGSGVYCKTGDMGRYNPDGTIQYLGRRIAPKTAFGCELSGSVLIDTPEGEKSSPTTQTPDETDAMKRTTLPMTPVAIPEVESSSESESDEELEPFDLLPNYIRTIDWENEASELCGLAENDVIENAMPVTPFQEGLMALSVKQPKSHIARWAYKISEKANVTRFKKAWIKTVMLCPNLRTRIINLHQTTVQLSVANDCSWEDTSDGGLEAFMTKMKEVNMSLGDRLSRWGLVKEPSGELYFVLILHHAIYDGWTLRLILQTVTNTYNRTGGISPIPLDPFIKYIRSIDPQIARQYWTDQLKEATVATFPPACGSKQAGKAKTMMKEIDMPSSVHNSITQATIMRAAWVLLLAQYCQSDDVCFATSVSGRQAPVVGIVHMAGPAVTTMPVRCRLDRNISVSSFLQGIQDQARKMIPYEQFGLQNILKLGKEIRDACNFSSLLVIQPYDNLLKPESKSDELLAMHSEYEDKDSSLEGYFTYPLVAQALTSSSHTVLNITYDSLQLSELQATGIANQFEHIVRGLLQASSEPLGQLSISGPWDLKKAQDMNDEIPEIFETTFHELVAEQAAIRPEFVAIRAWDATLTYAELDQMADQLALHLVSALGVKRGQLIHVCFEKSIWHFVSILAINKAGAAWVPIDPTHPYGRQQQIVSQTNAELILVSSQNESLGLRLVQNVLVVTLKLLTELSKETTNSKFHQLDGIASPSDACYVLFTSGSTGIPKGFVMSHKSTCTSQMAIYKRLGLGPEVNMLQFATYVFDMSVGETIGPLINGATVCVPSEETRMNNLTGFIRDMNITWLFLTPSFTRTLKPESVPSVQLLIMAGEIVTQDILDTWFSKVRLINGWGPAETCCLSSLHEWKSSDESPLTIGRPVGGYCWVVDPNDHRKLAPIGTLGEVVVQGPTLLREYLNDPKKTAESVHDDLSDWGVRPDQNHWNRFYVTGDLCFINSQGLLEFSTRKDTQIKIRGLRVELSEVEHQIRCHLPGICQIGVDVFEGEAGKTLVAYLCFTSAVTIGQKANDENELFASIGSDLQTLLLTMVGKLEVTLPRYMIPTLFIPCNYMPFISSSKLDKRTLQAETSKLSSELIHHYSLVDAAKQMPNTPMELRIQELWADLLNLPVDSIGRDDNFLRIGGDSITAIHFVNASRESGISLTVKNIFDDPRLSAVAACAITTRVECESEGNLTPFELLSPSLRSFSLSEEVRLVCELREDQVIENAIPVTPLQEGLMALAVKQSGSYIVRWVYSIPEQVDLGQFRRAWEQTVRICGNLRGRIVRANDSTLQVYVKDDIFWEDTSDMDLRMFLDKASRTEMSYGSRLNRYAIVEESQTNYFVLVAHHASYDGWSFQLMLGALSDCYRGNSTPKIKPFDHFIQYVQGMDHKEAEEFWRQQLQDAKPATFPPVTKSSSSPVTRVMNRDINGILLDRSITKATLVRAAWAIVLARYCGTNDICFGTSVSGRQAAVHGIDRICGPAIATLPIRIRLNESSTIKAFLHDIQSQMSSMIPYEQFGLQNIGKLSDEFKDLCNFPSLLIVQPYQKMTEIGGESSSILTPVELDEKQSEKNLSGYFTMPLVFQTVIYDESLRLNLTYDMNVITQHQATALINQIDHVIHELLKDSTRKLENISVAGQWDLKQASIVNESMPRLVNSTIHGMYEEQARIRPEALALHAWDEKFTYGQLNDCANRLAKHLIRSNLVKVEDLVPVCFEKSAWYFVSILAINKAGAAWVPLEPSHPRQRHEEVIRQTRARVVLTSPLNAHICSGLVDIVFEVSAKLDSVLTETSSNSVDVEVSPKYAAYVLFTSGSTGTPKGLVMEHRSVCTGQVAIGERLGLNSTAKILQFSAFCFDVSVGEMVGSFIHGATLFVPSEYDRMNDFVRYMQTNHIDTAFLTPTFLRTLRPEDLPALKLLISAGEAVGRDVFETWVEKVRLFNGWGPAETCVLSTIHEYKSRAESPHLIGRPVGGFCWIVEPDNSSQLAPVGAIGELAVQGPTILREYLADTVKTSAAVLTDLPEWAPYRTQEPWSRFYLSGDLCSLNSEGFIEFVGRKDNQVKIRGLRVELEEVEYHIVSLLKRVSQVAVDVIRTNETTKVVAYFTLHGLGSAPEHKDSGSEALFGHIDSELTQSLTELSGELRLVLPSYMVPSMFIPCNYMPMNSSSKLDRKALRQHSVKLTPDQFQHYSMASASKRAIETPMESQLVSVWAKVLKLSEQAIGRDDSFFQLGGDSISAIQAVAAARDVGIYITVNDIFKDARLFKVAAGATNIDVESAALENLQPFDTLPQPLKETEWETEAKNLCGLAPAQEFENAMPVTAFQEGLMALSVKQIGSYISRWVYKIPENIDVNRFKVAWEKTLRRCGILRTRIITIRQNTIQIVVKDDFTWEDTQEMTLRGYMNQVKRIGMTLGSRLNRWALVQEPKNGSSYFVLIAHHAAYDGWTLQIILRTLADFYYGNTTSTPASFDTFIKHILRVDQDKAKEYWMEQLKDAKRATYPSSFQDTRPEESASGVLSKDIQLPVSQHASITQATIFRAAWAMILAQYCGTDSVCFGTTVSGRQAPVPNISEIAGPVVTTVPVHVRFDRNMSVTEFLQSVQSQASEMISYEQYGLHNILKLGNPIRDACNFSSLLVVQPYNKMAEIGNESNAILIPADYGDDASQLVEGYFSFPLVVQGLISENHVKLHLTYDTSTMNEFQITALSNQLEHVIKTLNSETITSLNSIPMASPWDLQQARGMNQETPELVKSTFHDMVTRQAYLDPKAVAIHAWDGILTYSELDNNVKYLAFYLVTSLGVKRGDRIHVCFEKSVWYFISILAINKAGATWVPIDPLHPVERQKQVVSQTGAKLVLTSSLYRENASRLVDQYLVVTQKLLADLAGRKLDLDKIEGIASPEDDCYILFTSGSTGIPKGLVMRHFSVCTNEIACGTRLGITPKVNMLQFAAFVFDLSIGEIICPLISGATICVPSDETRMNDLGTFVTMTNCSWAYLTPSFVRTLKPEEVPSLELLVLAGEAVTQDIFEMWIGKVRLFNAWGPAETCCISTLHEYSVHDSPQTIGMAVGGSCWIVDPEDPNKPTPIGALGEVIIQGPTILREYLDDPKRTAETTIGDLPTWVTNKERTHWNRFYKSGDLCFVNKRGIMEFVSRKDTQVKIRGVRVELSEVEHQILLNMPNICQVAVGVYSTSAGSNLVAYLCYSNSNQIIHTPDDYTDAFMSIDPSLHEELIILLGTLGNSLPRYMIPTIFIPCRYMPFITSSKLDRKSLHAATMMLDQEKMREYALQAKKTCPPETDMEFRIQEIWATVLNLSTESIGRHDSFLALGGDSVTAIHAVATAREAGIDMQVRHIFNDPRLFAVAAKSMVLPKDGEQIQVLSPFELLPSCLKGIDWENQARLTCQLSSEQVIENAMPVTPFQEGLMITSVKQPGSYVAQWVYRIPENVEIDRFKKAWGKSLHLFANLRTRIIQVKESTIQVIVKDDNAWDESDELDMQTYLDQKRNMQVNFGSPLCHWAIRQDDEGIEHFILTAHHAIYDGWSLQLLLQAVAGFYYGDTISKAKPFDYFIKYTQDMNLDNAEKYWLSQLDDAKPAAFPTVNSRLSRSETCVLDKSITLPSKSWHKSITQATLVRATWSLLLAQYCEADDICFGTTVSGRQAPVPDINQIAGPHVATLPIRVHIDRRVSVSDFLQSIQAQATDMIPYEQYGLQNILKLSEPIRDACNFSSLLVVQPYNKMAKIGNSSNSLLIPASQQDQSQSMDGYFSFPLVLQTLVSDGLIQLNMTYNSLALSQSQAVALSNQFEHIIQLLTRETSKSLDQLSIAGPWDIQQSKEFNSELPDIINSTVHDLVAQQAEIRPEAMAINAWDAKLSYKELHSKAKSLGAYLAGRLGVGLGDFVLMHFDKSAWHFVSILAVNMTGAAWVPIDPSHPLERKKQIASQTKAKLVLTTAQYSDVCEAFIDSVLDISPEFITELTEDTSYSRGPEAIVSPSEACYVLFTSGSTGIPKGLVMEHRAVCTNEIACAKRLGLTPEVNMLQFAAFVFDLSIGEIIAPLISGATLCVPSEYIRMNGLVDFICETNVTWSYLTPSFARTIKPETVPSLELLVLAGEAVIRDVFEMWFGKLRLLNAWGPAETCCISTLHEWKSIDESPSTIGRPVGGQCWVVKPDNPQTLAPFGTVGEVLIQAPTLLREYLADPKRTAESTLDQIPSWGYHSEDKNWARMYKTGDLCFHNAEGLLEFSTRKDTQVKIRGQRVELSEVEFHVQESLRGVRQVVVDVFRTDVSVNLVAYICYTDEIKRGNKGELFLPLNPEISSALMELTSRLSVLLPAYEVPTMFIPCAYMPNNISGKLDRGVLKLATSNLSQESLALYSLSSQEKRAPETPMEIRMQGLWATILKVSPDTIGRDDSFLRIGGDSISAIQLASLAQDQGLRITVGEIFKDSRLSSLASAAATGVEYLSESIEPFSLVPFHSMAEIGAEVQRLGKLAAVPDLEDAFPACPHQDDMMGTIDAPVRIGSSVNKRVYKLSDNVDIERFKYSWDQAVSLFPNLRARILPLHGSNIQVILKQSQGWENAEGLTVRQFINNSGFLTSMGLGTSLSRFAIVNETTGTYFVWIHHHSIQDGWSLGMLLSALHGIYYDIPVAPLANVTGFVQHFLNIDLNSAATFWEKALEGVKQPRWPRASMPAVRSYESFELFHRHISIPNPGCIRFTLGTILLGAWGLAIKHFDSQYSSEEDSDIYVMRISSGRQLALPAIEKMPGLLTSDLPIPIRVRQGQTVSTFLSVLQDHCSECIPYEHFGARNIARLLPEDETADILDPITLMIPHATQTSGTGEGSGVENLLESPDQETWSPIEAINGSSTTAISLHCLIQDGSINASSYYSTDIITEEEVRALYNYLETAVVIMCEYPEMDIDEFLKKVDLKLDSSC